MPPVVQNIIVLAIVALSAAYIVRGAWRTIKQRSGGLGKCCEKGCDAKPNANSPRTVFMPVEMLGKPRK